MASANGCSERCSNEAARLRISALWSLLNATISVNCGFPWVRVPVLSKITVFILLAISSEAASFIKIPLPAALPEETIMAIGVARPKAQGQAIIKTATKLISAKVKAGIGPKNNQVIKVKTATMNTTGTKYEETKSARR